MTRLLAVAATALSLSFGAAQDNLGQGRALITWFEAPACAYNISIPEQAHQTLVLVEQQFCQSVPEVNNATANGVAASGYMVACAADGSGTVTFHSTNACNDAEPVVQNFAAGGCVDNGNAWGAQSYTVTCSPTAPPAVPELPAGAFAAAWFEQTQCPTTLDTHVSVVVADQDILHVVPSAAGSDANSGFSVQCAADGESGIIRFFTAANGSGTLQAQTAFNNGECLANPSQYGAASVRFFCNSRSASQDIRQALTHARLNWYQQSDCDANNSNEKQTSVVARQGFCQRVPDRDMGYKVICEVNESGQLTGGATIQFCDSTCGNCPASHAVGKNQCTPNAPGYGAAAFSISCDAGDNNLAATKGNAMIRWVAEPACANENLDYTLMTVPQGLCMLVPNSSAVATSGYKVTCDNSGNSGTFSVCNADCSACTINTPFNSQSGASECIENPAASGSSSVRFTCAEPTATAANSAKKTGGLATAAVFVSILVAMLSYIYMG